MLVLISMLNTSPLNNFIIFFLIISVHLYRCNVTALTPTTLDQSSNHLSSRPAGYQLVAEGVTHISLPLYTNTIEGDRRKIKQTNKHEQSLGLTKSRRRYCNTTCMCGLSLAWVTSENSTSNSNADILSRSSSPWLDPIFSATVSGVRCWLPLSVVPRQLCFLSSRQLLPAHLSSQPSFASPYHFRIRRDFRSKNPLSGFAPKQTKESSARATHIVLHRIL